MRMDVSNSMDLVLYLCGFIFTPVNTPPDFYLSSIPSIIGAVSHFRHPEVEARETDCLEMVLPLYQLSTARSGSS